MNYPNDISPALSSNPEVADAQRKLLARRQKELRTEKAKLDMLERNVKLIAKKMGVELA